MLSDRKVIDLANALVKDRCASGEEPGCCAMHATAPMMAYALLRIVISKQLNKELALMARATLRAAKGDEDANR